MLTIGSFDWRRLTPLAELEYRLDERGAIVLRGADGDSPPLTVARVRDGHGGFGARPLDAMGLVWSRPDTGDGWILRTSGAPTTMAHIAARWTDLVERTADDSNIDERLVLTLIAAETGDVAPDADGLVRAPRTERGYPGRTGESDQGDFTRDAQDWKASRGAHSSHGLLQTLIGTAVAARPDLFTDVDPGVYRTVLWDPANSIACSVAYLAGFAPSELADPVAARVRYGSGSIRPEANAWGAHVYDDFVMLSFLARWNDDACLRTSACNVPFEVPATDAKKFAWITLGFACFALSVVAGLYGLRYAKPAEGAS